MSNDFFDKKADSLLDQLEIMDKQFMFYAKEAERIDNLSAEIDYLNISEDEKDSKQLKLNKQIGELFARYKNDTEYFDKLLLEVDDYFIKKYNINMNLRELVNGTDKS